MNTIGIIPSRYASSRLPGKPLRMIHGKTMIQRVYEQAAQASLTALYVATDDERIAQHVQSFGGKALMTSGELGSGTERCRAAAEWLSCNDDDVVINIQGDEPFVHPHHINTLAALCKKENVEVGTLYASVSKERDLWDPGIPKLVCSRSGRVLYFSRSTIPFVRNADAPEWLLHTAFKKHMGLYGYRVSALKMLAALPATELEKAEMLEQLRWMEHDVIIYATEVEEGGISVDTPEDLQRAIDFAVQNESA
jgi:3-deoxy-manno-octulosonate cytidylyltransferase (CMP-KDO synthetase)